MRQEENDGSIFKCVFKKEDKRDRAVRGGVALSNGLVQDVLTSALPTGRGRA